MNKELEEAIKCYKSLKRNKTIIKDIDKEYFFRFADTLLNYIENSIPKDKVEKKIKELKSKCGGNIFHIQQTINAEIKLLQELIEGE